LLACPQAVVAASMGREDKRGDDFDRHAPRSVAIRLFNYITKKNADFQKTNQFISVQFNRKACVPGKCRRLM
jgi:hypothetical protein